MALKHVTDHHRREEHRRLHMAAPTLAVAFPAVREVSVALRFTDPDDKQHPSPHRRIFAPGMHAYFDFPCPLRECEGGGFDLTKSITHMLQDRSALPEGRRRCQGHRAKSGLANQSCLLELQFQVTVHDQPETALTVAALASPRLRKQKSR